MLEEEEEEETRGSFMNIIDYVNQKLLILFLR